METRLPTNPDPASADQAVAPATPAEDLPGLYRTILERIAELEQMGERVEAGRIRISATTVYSGAWDEAGRGRLVALIARADRAIVGHDQPRGWTMRRRSAAAR
jgi:hypothetical protein